MKSEKMYDFRKKLLTVHDNGVRNPERKKEINEFEITNGAVISLSPDASDVVKLAAYDFVDFLNVSMSVTSGVQFGAEKSQISLSLAEESSVDLGEYASYKGFLIKTDEAGIKIYGHDDRGIAQALFYIEDLMCFAKAPCLEFGEIKKKPMFYPQMIHSGYGIDEFPDNYLMRVAHEGRDAILVFTKDVNLTTCGYLNFNELIDRAAKYGIDVYAYSYMKSQVSPEDPKAEEYYESNYGKLFRECPGLKGVTLVGESVEFPSKDPHVAKGTFREINKDGIPSDKPSSGWYPCYDYPVWLNFIKKIIRKYKPDADIVFWTYNWGNQPEEARVKLIESLPTDITLQATFEMFNQIKYGKSTGMNDDYSLSFAGPSTYFASEASAAKKRGIRLHSMTNTGGRTWDFGVAPYEPMPYQWMKRYEAMRKAHDDWGLCGLMEGHHYGFYPSFISKLSKHCFFEPREDMNELLKKILISEFGEESYDAVDEAMKHFSEGIRYYTPSEADQYGAYRVGPSYPFNLAGGKHLGAHAKIPEYEGAHFGNHICRELYTVKAEDEVSPVGMRIKEELEFQNKMLSHFEEGVKLLETAEGRNEKLDTLINLCRFLRNCVVTGRNAKQWQILKSKMFVEDTSEGLAKIFDDMEQLLKAELENAQDTIPLVEKDSLLGFEPSMLYMTDKWHLEWKIRQINYVINSEIAMFRRALEL